MGTHQVVEKVLVQALRMRRWSCLKMRLAAATSTPSLVAVTTSSTRRTGVFRLYMGVFQRTLTLVWHAWQRKYWTVSAPWCSPSPASACSRLSVMWYYAQRGLGQ